MAKSPAIDVKTFRKRLVTRRKELNEIIEHSAETHTNIELDEVEMGRLSRMDAIQQHAMEDETDRRRVQELSRIDSALERMEAGDYGYCTSCDEPIAVKRLENDPAAALCIDCATRAEHHH